MRIVTIIPIARGISKDTLTYFTKKDVESGCIVSVPLRKNTVYGLVVESRKAEEMKSELKSLSYNIKKIDDIQASSFLSPAFIKSSQEIADYSASSVGAVLSALIPKIILENSDELKFVSKEKPENIFHETLLLQSDDEERYATYRSLIREEFARGRSVFFCLPTTEDIVNSRTTLEKGIEKYTITLHSGLSKKEILANWKKIIEENHPVLIVSTASFLCIPRTDLGTIVLEKESSRGYKMQTRPFLDIRTAVEIMAKKLGVRLVLGDLLLRTETLWEEKNPNTTTVYSELSPLKFRSLSTATCEIADMKTPEDMKKKEFKIFGDKLKEILKHAVENNEHTFLFCGRRGLYPMTVCSDCGTVVVCKNCSATVVLYTKKGSGKENLFVCNHCGERRSAKELCGHCGGWRLNPLGIGTERVLEEIESIMPKAKVIVMDKEHIKNHKQAVKSRDEFYSTPGSIMIGTEMALTYINQRIENSVVVSLDSYFSIPDFQINDKVFHILLTLRALSDKNFLIQSRQPDKKIFEYAVRGNLIDFYREEIEDRKAIGYPPFRTYIKITLEGEKSKIKKQMEETTEYLKPYDLTVFDAWSPGSKTQYMVHGLISIPNGKWVDKNLLEKLRGLSPQYTIKIDPATLL